MLKFVIIVVIILIIALLVTLASIYKKMIINIISCTLILICITLGVLFSLGYGFSNKMALYLGGYGDIDSDLESFKFDEYTFNVLLLDFDDAPKEDKIFGGVFIPVKKSGFLYKVKEYDNNIEFKEESINLSGSFASYKLDDKYINFILEINKLNSDGRLYHPLVLNVIAEDKEVEVYYYSYFFTDNAITSFYINHMKVDIYEKD